MTLRLFRALMPQGERIVDRFCEHSKRMVWATEAFRAMLAGDSDIEAKCAEISRIEEDADVITRETIQAIHRSFITPFDRSQILDLITALDDTIVPYYAATGRPSVDPELMIRMPLIGYAFAVRSERRLCDYVHLNLAYSWFCRLGLEGVVPDHSTFSKNRSSRCYRRRRPNVRKTAEAVRQLRLIALCRRWRARRNRHTKALLSRFAMES